jgi:hypothetical protein
MSRYGVTEQILHCNTQFNERHYWAYFVNKSLNVAHYKAMFCSCFFSAISAPPRDPHHFTQSLWRYAECVETTYRIKNALFVSSCDTLLPRRQGRRMGCEIWFTRRREEGKKRGLTYIAFMCYLCYPLNFSYHHSSDHHFPQYPQSP